MSDTLQTLRESKSLPVGSRFQAICAMGEVSTKTAKTGTSYHEVTLADATDDSLITAMLAHDGTGLARALRERRLHD